MSVRQFLVDEAKSVLTVQNYLNENNEFFMKLSQFFSVSYIIAILFPVFASLDTKLGYQILLVTTSAEWVSTLMKWVLVEDRPYWFVQEARVNVPLRQSEITCETGPGSPSAHLMGTSALLYVLSRWLIVWFENNVPPEFEKFRRFFRAFLWFIYVNIIALVSLSRINVAALFPHQCVLGAIFGYLTAAFLVGEGRWSLWNWIRASSKCRMLALAFALSGVSIGGYLSHRLFGVDAGWSIKLAFKWCLRTTTVSVQTTPVFALVRDSGSFVGLAIASPYKERRFYPVVGAIITTLFVSALRLFRPLLPTNDAVQFYTFHFLENLIGTLCLLIVIPYISSLLRFKEKTN